MNNTSKFKEYSISSDEMKEVKGGAFCQATCNDGSGAWTGNYYTYAAMSRSLNTYCSGSGGSYYCNGSLQ